MRDMLAHAREARSLIDGRNEDDLHTNRLLQLEITRLVEIVGEAANRVSPEGWRRWPEIPWREAITTRNRIVHQYDQIDYRIVWGTVRDDFPLLIAALERALATASD